MCSLWTKCVMRKYCWVKGVVIIVDAMNTANQSVKVSRRLSVKSYQEIVVIRMEILKGEEICRVGLSLSIIVCKKVKLKGSACYQLMR
eukprot:Pgem_evm1s5465